ncbi:MAG: hypothetical protein K1W28_16280 [Lachnospiraceae bacterium]
MGIYLNSKKPYDNYKEIVERIGNMLCGLCRRQAASSNTQERFWPLVLLMIRRPKNMSAR